MGPVVCQDMVESNADVWKRATDHPFLQQCKDATIPRQSFNWWLVQDYGFVLKFVDLAKAIISKAPAQDQQSLQGSLAVLDDELVFYQEQAKLRDISLNVEAAPVMQKYAQLMADLQQAPYPVLATGFWAIEHVYNQAWRSQGAMKAPYDIFADRWGSQRFSDYVKQLAAQANKALQGADQAQQQAAYEISKRIAQLEEDVWDAAMSAS